MFGEGGLFGGGERYPLELARALSSHVDCRLVSFGHEPRTVVEDGGLERITIKPRALYRNHPVHPLAPVIIAKTRGADLVHTHHMRSASSRVAALASKVRGQRTVVTDHGLGGGGWLGLLPRLFDVFACVSRYSAATLRIPPAKTHVVYGGADTARFHPGPPEERSGVLFVGRITPHKGIDVLIRALPQGERLRVAGTQGHEPGSAERGYPELLQRLATSKDVTFLGRVPERELPALYGRARVLVLPSVHRTCYGRWIAIPELLGLSLLEAMASGTPVIASRVGGLPEVVVDGETGYLVEPGDTGELHARISEVLQNRSLARRLGENARDLVTARFTWDDCARRCLEAYESAPPKRGSATSSFPPE
jgi:glycosyltransferase involved in cell wall biosynthesis